MFVVIDKSFVKMNFLKNSIFKFFKAQNDRKGSSFKIN